MNIQITTVSMRYDAEGLVSNVQVHFNGNDEQRTVNINGYVPFNESVGENVYAVDYKAMGFKEQPTVPSPYSDTFLPIVVGGDGIFYVDYSIDLNRILKEQQPDVKVGEDIRYLLADNYPVLPAYSLPYTVNENNEPVFMKKLK